MKPFLSGVRTDLCDSTACIVVIVIKKPALYNSILMNIILFLPFPKNWNSAQELPFFFGKKHGATDCQPKKQAVKKKLQHSFVISG
jgi:hypothetical protein